MRLDGSNGGRRNAKRLRKEMTPPEIGLWLALRRNPGGLRFRKQPAASDVLTNLEGVVREVMVIATHRRGAIDS